MTADNINGIDRHEHLLADEADHDVRLDLEGLRVGSRIFGSVPVSAVPAGAVAATPDPQGSRIAAAGHSRRQAAPVGERRDPRVERAYRAARQERAAVAALYGHRSGTVTVTSLNKNAATDRQGSAAA
jgi:hypothetical protein